MVFDDDGDDDEKEKGVYIINRWLFWERENF